MFFTPPTNFALFKQRRKNFIETLKHTYPDKQTIILLMADFETDRHIFVKKAHFIILLA